MNHQLAVRLLTLALLCGVVSSELLDFWGANCLAFGRDVYHPLQVGRSVTQPDSSIDADLASKVDQSSSIASQAFVTVPPALRSDSGRGIRSSDRTARMLDHVQTGHEVFRFASSSQNRVPSITPSTDRVGQDEAQTNATLTRQETIRALIAQLGAEEFSQREAATTALTRLGIPAIEPLEQVLDHPDREVRYRASRILATIQKVHLEARLEQFLRGESISSETELPGWNRFHELVGDNEKTRQFFVELQKREHRLLSALDDEPTAIAKTLTQRSTQLYALYRDPNDRLEETSIAALLLLAGAPDVKLDEPTFVALYYLCKSAGFYDAIKQGQNRETLQRLLAPFLVKADWGTAYQALVLGLSYDVPEVIAIAEEILADRGNAATHLQRYAIEAIAKFGEKQHREILAPIFDDDTRLHARALGDQTLVTEMRDLALAASIHLMGLRHADFGFKYVAFHEEFVFVDSSVGFESDAQRDAAFAKWRKLSQTWETPAK